MLLWVRGLHHAIRGRRRWEKHVVTNVFINGIDIVQQLDVARPLHLGKPVEYGLCIIRDSFKLS